MIESIHLAATATAVPPLAFGAWALALVFSIINAAILTIRLRAEEVVLAPRRLR